MDTFTKTRGPPSAACSPRAREQPDRLAPGDHGMSWTGYGDGWSLKESGGRRATSRLRCCRSTTGCSISVCIATPTAIPSAPILRRCPVAIATRHMARGRFCERMAPADSHNLDDFNQAPLLWPQNDGDSPSAESDFPEGNLYRSRLPRIRALRGSGSQDYFSIRIRRCRRSPRRNGTCTRRLGAGVPAPTTSTASWSDQHPPGWSGPERWQMQVEPSGNKRRRCRRCAHRGGSGSVTRRHERARRPSVSQTAIAAPSV